MQADEGSPVGSFVLIDNEGRDMASVGSSRRNSVDVAGNEAVNIAGSSHGRAHGAASGLAARVIEAARQALGDASYSASTREAINVRRGELQGVLFLDALLQMVAPSYDSSLYPPADPNAVFRLVDLIAATPLDRIKKAALLYYLCLDLDEQHKREHGSKGGKAVIFGRQTGLPRQVCQIIEGYWNLDHGNYTLASVHLTEPDPTLLPKILSTFSPLPFTSSSSTEAAGRSHALSNFLRVARINDKPIDGISKEEQVVLDCFQDGVWTAWKHMRTFAEEKEIDAAIGRILEHCFMPVPRAAAIKDLIAAPLSAPEEEALAHNAVNIPPNVSLSPRAHAMAIDVLLVRLINSGKHLEAVNLDRRVKASLDITGLSSDARDEKERNILRSLRERRETMMRGVWSSLTKMDKSFLEIGEAAEPGVADGTESADVESTQTQSVDVMEESEAVLVPRQVGDVTQDKVDTPAIRTPILRPVDSVLSAIASVSPLRRSSAAASPLVQSGRATPSLQPMIGDTSASGSVLRGDASMTGLSMRDTPAAASPSQRSTPLRLSRATRPYHLASTMLDTDTAPRQDEADASMVSAASRDVGNESQGPYSDLARQLAEEMRKDGSSVDTILRGVMNTSPFTTGTPGKNAHATLTFKKPVHRYEAKYEISDSSPHRNITRGLSDATSAMSPPTRRRQMTGRHTAASRSQAALDGASHNPDANHGDDDDDADTSVPGSFPGQSESAFDRDIEAQQSAKKGRARRTTRSRQNEVDEDIDAVPEMVQTPAMTRSKSGTIRRTPRASTITASTPLRRSARLSVEPEEGLLGHGAGAGDASPEMPTRRNAGGKGRGSTRQRASSPTKPDKQARTGTTSTPARRSTRATSQAPTDDGNEDDADDGESIGGRATAGRMTRSVSRRRASAMPGGL